MALCPWCRFHIGELVPGKSCPKCGRMAAELAGKSARPPAAAPVSSGADLELDLDIKPDIRPAAAPVAARPPPGQAPSFEGELQLSGPAPAPSAPAVSAPPSRASLPTPPPVDRSTLDDDDDILGEGPGADLSLDLDMGGGVGLPPGLTSSPRISGAPPQAPTSGRSLPVPPISQRSLPPVAEAQVDADAIDPYEARALADYGPAPTSFFLTPLYAWRVTRRRGELGRLVALKKDEATRAAQRAEDALVAFAERARPVAEQTGSRALEPLRAAEELMRGRDGALASEMDAHRADLARIDQQLGSIEHELAAARADEKRIDFEFAAAVEVKKRAEAKLKRADIEIRNAMQLLEGKKGAVS